jgi:hypothetical protein
LAGDFSFRGHRVVRGRFIRSTRMFDDSIDERFHHWIVSLKLGSFRNKAREKSSAIVIHKTYVTQINNQSPIGIRALGAKPATIQFPHPLVNKLAFESKSDEVFFLFDRYS